MLLIHNRGNVAQFGLHHLKFCKLSLEEQLDIKVWFNRNVAGLLQVPVTIIKVSVCWC